MIQEPLISVVIPAYNAEKFISKTLDSVFAQTYRNYELIVVDDGSVDKTAEVVEEYLAMRGLRGQCIRQLNKKIAGARNTGIRAASGSWIALLDHDDLWMAAKLEMVVQEISRNPKADLIWHNVKITKGGVTLSPVHIKEVCGELYQHLLFKGIMLPPSAAVFTKKAALSIGGFSENADFNTVEDLDFWLRLSREATFHFFDETLAEVVRLKTSASQNVLYHHRNMDIMLSSHLERYLSGAHGRRMQFRARKRLAVVYRSCLSQLMGCEENSDVQKDIAGKMMVTFPWDWKNIFRFSQWFLKSTLS